MNKNYLTSNEHYSVEKMTDRQQQIYSLKPYELNQLRIMADRLTNGKEILNYFIDISLLIIELNEQHEKYNDNSDIIYRLPNASEPEQLIYNAIHDCNDSVFTAVLSIGQKSVALNLASMCTTEPLYNFLADVKLQTFCLVLDNISEDHFADYI